jgi:hypothetical protein
MRGHGSVDVSLSGAVIEAFCRAWQVPLADVQAANASMREHEREIRVGHDGDREICTRGLRIVKPQKGQHA